MGKLPSRVSATKRLTEDQKKTTAKFGRCPKGHPLPHRTNQGTCTPIYCAGSKPGARQFKDLAKAEAIKIRDSETVQENALEEAELQVSRAIGRHKARMAFAKVPEFKDDKERDAWIEAKKKELIPIALADVEFSLKLGDQQEREKARREVLDMTGHGKKEAADRPPALFQIIWNGNGGSNGGPPPPSALPWVRRVDKDGNEIPQLPAGEVDAKK